MPPVGLLFPKGCDRNICTTYRGDPKSLHRAERSLFMTSRLADRLRAERRRRFVGRTDECALFKGAVLAPELPFLVLHIYGPGGIGKTTLLNEFAGVCADNEIPVIRLDASTTEPFPEAFSEALQREVGRDCEGAPLSWLANCTERQVLLIDTYENLAPLDDWVRNSLLPQLSDNILVVLAGRFPPTAPWRTDPGWQSLLCTVSLRNLSPEEGRSYLVERKIPLVQHRAVLEFTHGHPLALSLVADHFVQRPDLSFEAQVEPDIVKLLLERFVNSGLDLQQRLALETSALVRCTTESLLAEILELPDASEPFNWLRNLSFMETGVDGLYPHDLAREVLVADLRWRNRERYIDLHRRARNYYTERLRDAGQQLLFDYIFLHRDNPVVRPSFEWRQQSRLRVDHFRSDDLGTMLAAVERFESKASADLAAYWCKQQPEALQIFRDQSQKPVGFLMALALERTEATERAQDPALQKAWDYLQSHAPLRSGEGATHFRFWMGHETYHSVSPVQSLITVQMVRHYLMTPGLAFSFFPVRNPEHWAAVFAYADLVRIPEADYTVDGVFYGIYGHDWRVVPPIAWLARLAEREIALAVPPKIRPSTPTLVALSQAEFIQALRTALRDYTQPENLRTNPLLRSRLVIERGAAQQQEAVPALKELIKEVVESLQASPKQSKAYRALLYTYLQPMANQELVAERLDLPFSTYRRHLSAGLTQIQTMLWQRELQG